MYFPDNRWLVASLFLYRLIGKTLWEMNPTSMRNKVKYGVFDGKIMRNAVLEIISHKLFIWLFVVYQSPMRIWEMKIINTL